MKQIAILMLAIALASVTLAGCNKTEENVAVSPGASQQESAQAEESAETAEAPAESGYQSPLPNAATFIERYNIAAEELGAIGIDEFGTRPLSWNTEEGLHTVEGGFTFDAGPCSMMFDPYYVRIVARQDDMSEMILVYAAAVAAVTEVPLAECLPIIKDMVENPEEDTWDNGYEVNLGEAELAGVPIDYEMGRSTGISQLFINREGILLSHEREEME